MDIPVCDCVMFFEKHHPDCNVVKEFKQLEEQLEKAWNQIDFQQEAYRELLEERDALKAEIENLYAERAAIRLDRDLMKADAERYRWLREDRPESPLNVVNELGFWIHEETLDAAIDAARGE